MSSRSLLFVSGLLVVLSAVAPRPAEAQTTALFVDSQAGDSVGDGASRLFTSVDGTFTPSTSSSSGISINMTAPGFLSWTTRFKAGGAVPAPTVGTYEGARRLSFNTTPFNGLAVSGSGGSCSIISGRFVVREAVYDSSGVVVRFAADFEQHCEDSVPALFGAIRYNSTISDMVPFGGLYPRYRLTLTQPLHGTLTGGGLTCGTGGALCVADHASATTATIDATPDPGYVFAGWGGDCFGGPHAAVAIHMQRMCSASFVPLVPVAPRTIAVLMAVPNSGQAQGLVLSPASSMWTLSTTYGSGFILTIEAGGLRPDSNTFEFRPPTGQSFQAGVEYPTLSSPDATHAGLWASAYSLGSFSCSGPGTMAVREWVAAPGALPTRFSIDFRSDCSGVMTGTIQYAATYEYGQLNVNPRGLQFKAFADQSGIVSHSADQTFQITPAGPSPFTWELKSDQAWLTGSPASSTTGVTATAKIRNGGSAAAGTRTGRLQVFARGLINLPDPVTVTLDVTTPDFASRPFAVFRSTTGSWFMPTAAPQSFGLPGDIPLSGDFDGDGASDIAIYRPSTGEWFVQGQATRQWGVPGDIPVPADYNGDGRTDLAVFRPSVPSAQWFIFGEPAPHAWGVRGDVPVPGDYDGDGLADLAVFRPATGTWSILRSFTGQTVTTSFGLTGDIPLVADFDADRKIDVAVFRPSTGFWYLTLSVAGTSYSRQFGLPGDIPVPLDVTGDGRAELRVWRPSTGTWFSFNRSTSQSSSQQYGLAGDVPVMARPVLVGSRPDDADGDRRADVTVYRPSTGEWFTRQSSTGYGTFTVQPWGLEGDVPVPGDYDGDRRANPAVYRPSSGEWFARRFDGTMLQRSWGLPDDLPVPADYDGDGRTDMTVYRPSSGEWFILTSASDYAAYWTVSWGLPGDLPVPADFDGDGRADAAVYRPSTGEWLVAPSSGGWFVRQWGLPGDLPIARDFDGDGRADLAVYRPSTGEWYVLDAASGTPVFTRQWGLNGDVPVADDYDGDGAADVAVFRPATHEWFVRPSSGASSFVLQWGLAGDVPVTRR